MMLNDDGNTFFQEIGFLGYSEENWSISDPSVEELISDYYDSVES